MTQLTEHALFVTSCYTTYLEDVDNSKINERVLHLEKHDEGNHRSNHGGYQSNPIHFDEVDSAEVMRLFSNHIFPAAQRIVDSWDIKKELSQYVYWYNVNRRYNYNAIHDHPMSFVSGVYYSKVPKDSGVIRFIRSQTEMDRMSFQHNHMIHTGAIPNNNRINTEHWFVPSEGLLILFPGHLTHEVDQNLTPDEDDARISLSFNFF